MPEKRKRIFDFQKNRDWTEGLTIIMQLGLNMVGSILFCFFVGLYIDKWLSIKGVFTTIFYYFRGDRRRIYHLSSDHGDYRGQVPSEKK